MTDEYDSPEFGDELYNSIMLEYEEEVKGLLERIDKEDLWEEDLELLAEETDLDDMLTLDDFNSSLRGEDIPKEQYLERKVRSALSKCHNHKLGRIKRPKQMKCKNWTCKCRKAWYVAYVRICHPALDEVLDDALECSRQATIATGIAAIIAGPAAALPAFKAVFYACLLDKIGDRAKEIRVRLYTKKEYTKWGKC